MDNFSESVLEDEISIEDFFSQHTDTAQFKQLKACLLSAANPGDCLKISTARDIIGKLAWGFRNHYHPVYDAKTKRMFWSFLGGHPTVMSGLYCLHSGENHGLDVNADTFLTEGLGWYISSQDQNTIRCGLRYSPGVADQRAFDFLCVLEVDSPLS